MPFDLPSEKLNIKHMLKTFICSKCLGVIIKHLLYSSSLVPLAHVVLQQVRRIFENFSIKVRFNLTSSTGAQVLICMENINQNEGDQLGMPEIVVASCALLTSSK